MADDGLIKKTEDAINTVADLVHRIMGPEGVSSLDNGVAVSIGDRSKVEECQKKLRVGDKDKEANLCDIKKGEIKWDFDVVFKRLGFTVDKLTCTISLDWNYDGCGIYDVVLTEKHNPINSDWTVRIKGKVTLLKRKQKGECECCAEGICIFVSV